MDCALVRGLGVDEVGWVKRAEPRGAEQEFRAGKTGRTGKEISNRDCRSGSIAAATGCATRILRWRTSRPKEISTARLSEVHL